MTIGRHVVQQQETRAWPRCTTPDAVVDEETFAEYKSSANKGMLQVVVVLSHLHPPAQ
jgi:hypothetical protein